MIHLIHFCISGFEVLVLVKNQVIDLILQGPAARETEGAWMDEGADD